MNKKIDIQNIIGITVSTETEEFVIHLKMKENDDRYLMPRKFEIISTIAEAFYKYTNIKLLFSKVNDKSLSDYVTPKKQKIEDVNFTLMKNTNKGFCYIDDIIKEEKKKLKIEKNLIDGEENEALKKENDEKENLSINIMKFDQDNNYNFHSTNQANPFSKALIGGAVVGGAGVAAAGGSIAACIVFDSIYLVSTAGEIFAAGFTFLGGLAFTGIGLVVAVPSLLGFGAYKLYKMNKDKKRNEFFKNFDDIKMKIEKQIYLYIINKIDNYFLKPILSEDNEINSKIHYCQEYINTIIGIYINIDNNRFNLILESVKNNFSQDKKEKIFNKINNDIKITIINISKIRQELMKIVTSSLNKDIINIFKEGLPLFREFIRIFGPLNIDKEIQDLIDENIEKIIAEMKWILEQKMQIYFKNFNPKTFKNSFQVHLAQEFEKKSKLDINIKKSDFIDNCNDFLIEPISEKSNNYGVLSLFFKFMNIVQDNVSKKKDDSYNYMKKVLTNSFNQSIEYINNNNKENIKNEIKDKNNIPERLQDDMPPGNLPEIEQRNKQPLLPFTTPITFDILGNSKQNINNINKNKIINIKFLFNGDNEKNEIIVQGNIDMSVKKLIENFRSKLNKNNIIIKQYLINDKTPLCIDSNETLQEKGITEDIKIIIY